MWGNYADKSRGVCLKFEFNSDFEKSFELEPDIKISPLPLIYKKGIPSFNYIRYKLKIKQDINSPNQYFIGTKSKEWKDESEVRIVIEKEPGENFEKYVGVKFKPRYLKEIILGCISSKDDNDMIQKIIKCNTEYSHVKFTQLRKGGTKASV